MGKQRLSDEVIDRILALHDEGHSSLSIARQLGVSQSSVKLYRCPELRQQHNEERRAGPPRGDDYPVQLRRIAARDAARQTIPPPQWSDRAAYLMGDPVVGRRAIDRMENRSCR